MTRKIFKLKPLQHAILICFTATPLVALGLAPTTKVVPATKNPSLVYDVYFNPRVPRLTFNAQSGSYTLGQIDLMYPFLGRSDKFIFLDVRGEATTKDAQEYNLGLGYRGLVSQFQNPFIAGAYVWVDRRRSKNGNYYDQATGGLEYLGQSYDVRANIYIPYGNHSYVLSSTNDPFATGYTVGYVQNERLENSLNGADIEAGKVDLLQHRLRLYADYYHFGVGEDPVRMNGGRARTEFILENRWLDTMGSNLIFTASYQYDNVRHSAAFAGVRLNIGKDKPARSLLGRIEDLIIRDDDIVLVNSTRSQRYTNPSRFIFVDNSAAPGGDGTYEHPYQQEITAQNVSLPGDSIYTFTGNGPYSMPVGGLTLQSGQFFYGAGVDVTYNNVIVLPATGAPILNGRMNITNGNTLSGFTLSGTGVTEDAGIYGSGISHVSISDVTVQDFSGANDDGAYAYSSSGYATGGNGGTGGSVKGIDIQNSSHISLSRVTVQNIEGGSANGGGATANYYLPIAFNSAVSGDGGAGGAAVGIDLTGSSMVVLNNVTVTNIIGGSTNGGDASATYTTAVNYSNKNRAISGKGGVGGSAVGIDLTDVSTLTLSNVTINAVTGGAANSGDALAVSHGAYGNYTNPKNNSSAQGGYAKGISLIGASQVVSDYLTVNNIISGSADSAITRSISDNNHTGYNVGNNSRGGSAGDATGVDLTLSSGVVLNNTEVNNINAGSANGSSSTVENQSNTYAKSNLSYSGFGGYGGAALGVNLSGAQANLAAIHVSTVFGGSALGGDAIATGNVSYQKRVFSGRGGQGGVASGISASGGAVITLSSAIVSNIQGGGASGGSATANGDVFAHGFNFTYGDRGGTGGSAKGIELINSSLTLKDITISLVNAGDVSLGQALSVGYDGVYVRVYHFSSAGIAGQAVGIDLTTSTGTLQNATVTGVTGGNANGGDANASGAPLNKNYAIAGDGGTGGDATGIIRGGVTVNGYNISGLTAGTADGGTAVGNPATQGVNGTAGTATNVL